MSVFGTKDCRSKFHKLSGTIGAIYYRFRYDWSYIYTYLHIKRQIRYDLKMVTLC